jgi:hypothetical protein
MTRLQGSTKVAVRREEAEAEALDEDEEAAAQIA